MLETDYGMPGRLGEKQSIGIKQYLDMLCCERHSLWGGYKTDVQLIGGKLKTCDD